MQAYEALEACDADEAIRILEVRNDIDLVSDRLNRHRRNLFRQGAEQVRTNRSFNALSLVDSVLNCVL
jgi:hypothetical protein